MEEGRIRAVTAAVMRRAETLSQLAMSQAPVQDMTTDDDVQEDIAEDYTMRMEL